MGRLFKIITITGIFYFIFTSASLTAQENKGANAPLHVFTVHCEPTTAMERVFKALVNLTNLSDRYNVKLTMEFTPQWAKMILSDPAKLKLVHGWRENGHEIAAHHHPVQHRGKWDGYTNAKGMTKDSRYRGTMNDFINILNKLAYPHKIYTLASPDENDWVRGIPHRTEGFIPKAAVSVPRQTIIQGTAVCELGCGYLGSERQRLETLKRLYFSAGKDKSFCVTIHVFNFADTPELIEEWFQFIQAHDAQGTRSKTVSQVMNCYQCGKAARTAP